MAVLLEEELSELSDATMVEVFQQVFNHQARQMLSDASAGDFSAGATSIVQSFLLNAVLCGADAVQTRRFVGELFGRYALAMRAHPERSAEETMRGVLVAELGSESEDALASLGALVMRLEAVPDPLPEDFPYEQVLDALDRCTQAMVTSQGREVVAVYPAASGRGLGIRVLGCIAAHEAGLAAITGQERVGEGLEGGAKVAAYAGVAAAVGGVAKIAFGVKTLGLLFVAEALVAKYGLAAGTALGVAGAVADMGSDQAHFLLALSASQAWKAERETLREVLEATAEGVPAATKRDSPRVLVETFSAQAEVPLVSGTAVEAEFQRVRGRLVLRNDGDTSVEVSTLVVVPGTDPTGSFQFLTTRALEKWRRDRARSSPSS